MSGSDKKLNSTDMSPIESQPLILTLAFDPESASFFEAERRRHFPPERNQIPAHLTLFHHLPGDQEASIRQYLAALCAVTAPFAMEVSGLRFLGRGVAYGVVSPELEALRARCAAAFADHLIAQDRQGFRPHVTIQNKARPDEARALFNRMEAGFESFEVDAVGLLLWRYLGGPWERRAFFRFASPAEGS